ncbi:CMRF35-like molecule 8 [Archocentrus centrarchus]|uniref:CMRF35-like molecule 8 n=1 Tax=Archocentrus centrarchus TaxID=63155 RepID=UPI0011E9DA40|nr:CMRF35-like molecule 8 [Archocentrus centrarchus]
MKTICVFCLFYAATLTDGLKLIKVEGFQGRNVSFQCPHKLAWAYDKYLCKDPCTSREDRLVTVKSGGRAESGRITLVDSGDGSFTVTFSHLQLSDSQNYWCAVDRPGFDTYTEIQLTVKTAVETKTTVMPDVSTIWTYENTNTTQLTTGSDNVEPEPTNFSTASVVTDGEPKIHTGAVVSATIGGVAIIFLLMLTVCFRKYRKTPKPQLQVHVNSTDLGSAHEQEVTFGYNDTGKGVERMQKLPESSSVHTHQQRLNPPTSEPASKCSIPLHIYENISFSRLPENSGHLSMEDQNDHDDNSRIYINPLPETPVNPLKRSPEHSGSV